MKNMLKSIKRYWVLSSMLLMVLLLPIRLGLNYSGFCWEEKRWLSDEEMINGAVANLLMRGSTQKYIGILPYITVKLEEKNVDEFLENNSDCCHIANGNSFPIREAIPYNSDGIEIPDLEQRIRGLYRNLIVIYYKQGYLDLENNITKKQTVTFIPMTNCGLPYRWQD